MVTPPLIAPKHVSEFSDQEYHDYVTAMHQIRIKRGAKPPSPVVGLTVTRTKTGALRISRTKVRTFEYVLWWEIAKLAEALKCAQSELWQAFKARKFTIAKDRMEAEHIYSTINEIPWGESHGSSSNKKSKRHEKRKSVEGSSRLPQG